MKRKTYEYLFVGYILVFNICLFSIPAVALVEIKSFPTIEDATVDIHTPDTNYGGRYDLEVGHLIDWVEAYIKFDLSLAPFKFHKAKLILEFIHVENITQVYFYETSTSWEEYTITWANAPLHENKLGSFVVTVGSAIFIDITHVIKSQSGLWSICLASTDMNWLSLASKQCYSWYNPPKVVYYVQESYIPIFIAGIVALAILIGRKVYINHKRVKLPENQNDNEN